MFNFEVLKCPVCQTVLGRRHNAEIAKAHCDECRASFVWKPNDPRPTALLDRDEKRRYCGCGCGR